MNWKGLGIVVSWIVGLISLIEIIFLMIIGFGINFFIVYFGPIIAVLFSFANIKILKLERFKFKEFYEKTSPFALILIMIISSFFIWMIFAGLGR